MNTILVILPVAFVYASPIIIAALGGFFSERSGIVNIALEGIMMVGAFVCATVTVLIQSQVGAQSSGYYGLLAGLIAGIIFSIFHAIACVNLRSDQVISGTALNILAGGLTIFLCQVIFNQQRTAVFSTGLTKFSIPGLQDIPIIGILLFKNVSPVFYIALILVFVSWFAAYKTPFGLRLRSCGENPQASSSMGISVLKMRYSGVLISGAFAGLAGSAMVLTQDLQYTISSIHGTGFIALACLIFGKWSPFGVLGAGLFFGLAQAMSIFANDISFMKKIPLEFFYMLPYILTAIALVIFSSKSVGPRAAGEIYDAGKR